MSTILERTRQEVEEVAEVAPEASQGLGEPLFVNDSSRVFLTELWSEIDQIPARVEAGVAWLNDHAPANWRELIDLSDLDIRFGDRCVCGQVFKLPGQRIGQNGYEFVNVAFKGMDLASLGFTSSPEFASLGFHLASYWSSLQAEWLRVLA